MMAELYFELLNVYKWCVWKNMEIAKQINRLSVCDYHARSYCEKNRRKQT